ncbi:MAG: hypothetical protein EB028_06280, partial [Actinobacteria bacterium]|nr:hypothetical protein [Actinomycetota bacterium]
MGCVRQAWLDRRFVDRGGDLLIESASEDGQQLFGDIRNPEQVQNMIHEAIHARTGRDVDASP